MNKIILLSFLSFSILKIQAQSISTERIAACGDSYSNSTAMLSFSEGVFFDEFFISSSSTNTSIKSETIVSDIIKIYPNPFTNNTTVEIKSEIANPKSEIFIYDVQGNNVYQSNSTSSNFQIDLSAQPDGVYFISIQTHEGSVNKKIVKSK